MSDKGFWCWFVECGYHKTFLLTIGSIVLAFVYLFYIQQVAHFFYVNNLDLFPWGYFVVFLPLLVLVVVSVPYALYMDYRFDMELKKRR